MGISSSLLTVDHLSLDLRLRTRVVPVLKRVQFEVYHGETVGVIGEGDAGKSATADVIIGLLHASASIAHGHIVFGDLEMTGAAESTLQKVRGREMVMIAGHPRSTLNPIRSVGRQLEDVLRCRPDATRRTVRRQALQAMSRVNMPEPEHLYNAYLCELSEELCQRLSLAMALSAQPSLLIADDPTAGFDITAQAVIMSLIKTATVSRGMATLLFTRDVALAAAYCDRIMVMHAGHVVESAPTAAILKAPRHPYTAKLIAAMPVGQTAVSAMGTIPGHPPDLHLALPPCRFALRCDRRMAMCDAIPLPYTTIDVNHKVACWNPL